MTSTMDSSMVMPTSATEIPGPLSTAGVDFSDPDMAANFLQELLDDTESQVVSNHYAIYFWYGVVVVIGIMAILNLCMRMKSRSRLRATTKKQTSTPSPLSRAIEACTGLVRRITYIQVTPTHHAKLFHLPPFGIFALLLTYFGFVLGLEYVHQDVSGLQHDTAIGIRAGWLTITQMPLLILLSGKVNLIGLLTGLSYERLNTLHRWVARCMLITATLHWACQEALWARLGNGLVKLEWKIDACTTTGIQAYAFLLWMNLSTLAPIRNAWYELFVLQHILSFFALIISLMLHLPNTALYTRVYIWIPIGLYSLDRTLRSARYAYNNIRPGRASLMKLPGGMTKIVVKSRQLKNWTPGSFVLLGIPRFGIGQSHPATIVSIAGSGSTDLVFLLRAHGGFTKKIHAAASETPNTEELGSTAETHLALIDGPYGGTRLDFASFNTVVLIAGSSGCSFTLPILLDIASRSKISRIPVKKVILVWAIKTAACGIWIEDELNQAVETCRDAGIELVIQVHVTRDAEFVQESDGEAKGESESPNISDPGIAEKDVIQEVEREPGAASEKISSARLRLPFLSGRPDLRTILSESQQSSVGEMGVAVCGPLGLRVEVRGIVSNLEGNGESIYLHVEGFGW